MDLEKEIQFLRNEVMDLRRQQSSRRGPEGPKGPKGDSGRDAVLIVKTDTKENRVDIFNDSKRVAELVPIAGKDGKDAVINREELLQLIRQTWREMIDGLFSKADAK
jgi:hypothetical protein